MNTPLLQEKDLHKALARHQAIFTNAAAGIVHINARGVIESANPMVTTILGYQVEELIGKNVSILMPESIARHHDHYLSNYDRDKRQNSKHESSVIGVGRELEAQHKNGRKVPIHLAVSEVVVGGEGINEFIGIITDLSLIKEFENKLQKQKRLMDTLHTGITDYEQLIAGDTIWQFLQQSLREITESEYALIGEVVTGETGDELKVHALTDLSWDEDSRKLMNELVLGDGKISNQKSLLGRVFAKGEIVKTQSPSTEPGACGLPPGHPPLHNLLALPIKKQGEVLGMIAISNTSLKIDDELIELLEPFVGTCALLIQLYRQMNEREAFMVQLANTRDEMEAANRAKSEFLSSMSHELRTPLNSIIGFSQLLVSSPKSPLNEKQAKQVHQIHSSGKHLLTLINDILDLSKIEAGKLTISLEPTNLGSVIDESYETLKPLADRSGIELRMVASDLDIYAIADYTRLKQVMINLLSNAVKYNRPNGWVSVSSRVEEEQVHIEIRDSGIGIDEAHMETIFEPFNRGKAEGSAVEGTGVGLALTLKIVEYMNGKLSVNSDKSGSCFTVTLPLSSAVTATNNLKSEDQATNEPVSGANIRLNKRVLYVEDNPANQRLMEDIFEDLDHLDLTVAHEPHLGLDLAREHIPDLIILDIHMPGMDGFQLLRLLKSDQRTASIPCIALSANAMPSDVTRGLREGFDHYLTKPIDIPIFFEILDTYFEEE